MAVARYRIPDEPRPTGLVRYAVDPLWPLLAVMLAGNGAGLAWFALNSHALGSPTRVREWVCILASPILTVAALFAVAFAAEHDLLTGTAPKYALLVLPAIKLVFAYVLYMLQAPSAELLTHYGMPTKNGFPGLILCVLFGQMILPSLQLHGLLLLVLR